MAALPWDGASIVGWRRFQPWIMTGLKRRRGQGPEAIFELAELRVQLIQLVLLVKILPLQGLKALVLKAKAYLQLDQPGLGVFSVGGHRDWPGRAQSA